jgi:signal transduction histidine kinase
VEPAASPLPTLDRPTLLRIVALLVAYVATAVIGIALPVAEGVVTPVWAPTGIATVALFIGGRRLWPAVYIAAFVGNYLSGAGLALAPAIAIGNTGQALVGAWMLERLGFRPQLQRTRDIGAIVAAAFASCLVSATNGCVMLLAAAELTAGAFAHRWLLWWFGDVMGVLVVGALLFAAMTQGPALLRSGLRRRLEFVAIAAAMCALSLTVFANETWFLPQLLLPLWLIMAIRYHALGATVGTFIVAVVSIAFTIDGSVVLEGTTPTQTVQVIHAMLIVVGLGKLVAAAAISERDISRATLEAALHDEREVGRQLREVDEMKDSLLAAVSHELRTPLTSILALASMLRDRHRELGPDKVDEMCEFLTNQSRRLDSLLQDLLDLERLRMGLLQPRYERVDVAALVRESHARFAVETRPAKLNLEPVMIEADPAKLERIVDNLIGNAYKHTPIDKHVWVRVASSEGGALITVEDEGHGVPDEHKATVFEPFNRGDADTFTAAPGTGIGLSLVAHFTALHGGRAWVEDRVGGGASVRVFLPGAAIAGA